jgi:hypothetical protein
MAEQEEDMKCKRILLTARQKQGIVWKEKKIKNLTLTVREFNKRIVDI